MPKVKERFQHKSIPLKGIEEENVMRMAEIEKAKSKYYEGWYPCTSKVKKSCRTYDQEAVSATSAKKCVRISEKEK